jgi:hypothetical protein
VKVELCSEIVDIYDENTKLNVLTEMGVSKHKFLLFIIVKYERETFRSCAET